MSYANATIGWAGAHQILRTSERRSPEHAHSLALAGADSLLVGDTLLTAFYDSCFAANIGKLERASKVAAFPLVMGVADKYVFLPAETLEVYLDTLEGLSISILPEDALRDVLVIAFQELLDTTTVVDSLQLTMDGMLELLFPDSMITAPRVKRGYSSTQVANLTTLAQECPSEFGTAVFMARAMLSSLDTIPYVYAHDCETVALPPSERRGEEETSNELLASDIKVYPNPANDAVTVNVALKEGEIGQFELWSITGVRMKQVNLINGNNTLEVSGLLSGIYFYMIHVNHQKVSSGKQVIIR